MRFAPGEFYHIYNRGVENRHIFMDENDYARFQKGLWVFNCDHPITIRDLPQNPEIRSLGKPLASVVSYVLMKNHIHLLVHSIGEKKLSEFLRKIFIGYSMYFNAKYQRKGVLFQGRSKSKHVDNDVYLKHLVNYIHLNPLDYHFPQWREGKVQKIKNAKDIFLSYPWSSLRGISAPRQDPSLDYEIISEVFPAKDELIQSMEEWSASVYQENKEVFIEKS